MDKFVFRVRAPACGRKANELTRLLASQGLAGAVAWPDERERDWHNIDVRRWGNSYPEVVEFVRARVRLLCGDVIGPTVRAFRAEELSDELADEISRALPGAPENPEG